MSLSRRLLVVSLSLLVLMMSFTPVDAAIPGKVDMVTLSVDPADAAPASNITSEAMIEAKHILRTAYERPVTQAEVTMRLEAMMRAEGADGDLSFPTLVMSGSELTEPHGDPYDDVLHVINPSTNPVVMIDMGCKFNGFCSDVTRTFFFETATQEIFDAYNAVLTAHEAVIDAVGPGVEISDLDAILEVYLANYTGIPGISLLTYWGHGVGEYVHENPLLYNVADVLEVDDVIAIEPGIYSEAGWAVRIEDTVRVTDSGVEVLSHAPRDLEDVMILQSQPSVEADITVAGYDYGSDTTVEVSIIDSATRSILSVDWYDGYSWIEMNHIVGPHFDLTYNLNYSYSGRLECIARVHFSNDTYYFRELVQSSVESTGSTTLDPPLYFTDSILPPESPLIWTFAETGAEMIRLRFSRMSGGHDQLLIEDSSSSPVIDYRLLEKGSLWTPWVAGDTLNVHVIATEPEFLGGVDIFSFSIDRIEFFDADFQPQPTTTTTTTTPSSPTTTTSSTEPSTTTTTTPSPPDEFPLELFQIGSYGVIGGILAIAIIWVRRK
ncbi:MAG: M24 family metallopeptidase [Candidatus Thorarchaeota archaeon]